MLFYIQSRGQNTQKVLATLLMQMDQYTALVQRVGLAGQSAEELTQLRQFLNRIRANINGDAR